MPIEHHTKSEALASEAELAVRAGDRGRAIKLYARAAGYELQALNGIPEQKARTRGILAVSAASLYYKAREWDAAEQVIFRFLSETGLASKFRQDLRELLEVVWDERVLEEEQHSHYAGDGMVVSMRGGLVGFGTTTLDQFLHTFDGMRNLFYRVTEWVAGVPFRPSGLPREEIRELLKARTTQPAGGSYRFRIRLVEPNQLKLFDDAPLRPEEVTKTLFNFVESASTGNEQQLVAVVPDEQYRTAMLKLLRNISPDGTRMKELQFQREGAAVGDSVSITKEIRFQIREHLNKRSPNETPAQEVVGTLRALDLDKKSIEVSLPGAEDRKRYYASELILDDVVGPMVNQRVLVTGIRRHKQRQMFRDIELETAG